MQKQNEYNDFWTYNCYSYRNLSSYVWVYFFGELLSFVIYFCNKQATLTVTHN